MLLKPIDLKATLQWQQRSSIVYTEPPLYTKTEIPTPVKRCILIISSLVKSGYTRRTQLYHKPLDKPWREKD